MKKFVQVIGFSSVIKLFSFLKMSYLGGAHFLCLSGSAIIAPLAGPFVGISGSIGILLLRLAFHALFFTINSLSFLALCIPGFFASVYLASRATLIRLFVPIACMVLFVMHPIGAQAFLYSFFWLIPIVLFFIQKKSLFLDALGATFVAHAVGSVIWLYTVPMMPYMWLELIPHVIVERLSCAFAMFILLKCLFAMKDVKLFSQTRAHQEIMGL